MNGLDWTVVAVYLTGMIGLSWHLGRKQADAKDYYLGGNDLTDLPMTLAKCTRLEILFVLAADA